MSKATILIVARNASRTIERAVGSAIGQGDFSIVLVDDESNDDTISRAEAAGGGSLRVLKIGSHSTLGKARQLGLQSIDTEYCVLLDADDVLLPGRVGRLVATMESEGSDAVFDEVELWDEGENRFLKTLTIPGFLSEGKSLCRLFERNYLPGIGQMGFRVKRFRGIGYDPEIHGPEDTDIVLRALESGARFSLVRQVGYRMYHAGGSVSRNLGRQNAELRRVLQKHSYERVAELYRDAGYSRRIGLWGLVSLATFRKDREAMGRFIGEIESDEVDLDQILEPEGPVPMSERWRLGFAKGSQALLEGKAAVALNCFRKIAVEGETAEVFNNWGVAEALLGDAAGGRKRFEKALKCFPGYADAAANLDHPTAARVTYLPLRRQASRDLY